MGYASLRECIDDLDRAGRLRRVTEEVDAHLEVAEVQRRVFAAGGPALLFERVRGCRFALASNLFGSMDRVRFIFRDALDGVRALVDAKVDPRAFATSPARAVRLPAVAMHLLPLPVRGGAVFAHRCEVRDLPQITSWPDDGGPFITLPQVFSEDPDAPGLRASNMGMYRVQLAGNDYVQDREVGLHYQIHRGLGVHHAHAIARGERLPVNIFVGGPPAMSVAAVMPLPEGLPEIAFAGALNRRSIRMARRGPGPHVHADADFVIRGSIGPSETKLEGPFGDHLGYYARAHHFPVLRVESVHHREGAIWPFTVVGRPPQEDTMFGELIHELTGPLVPTVLPGVSAVHAVDAAGVHPLLFAFGSERYVPYADAATRRPMELLTQANAILGQGQMSLAKYLFIASREDARGLDIHDVGGFLCHVLARFSPERDLHFHTNTTIDTLDYSGSGLNEGSKVVFAATGPARRALGSRLGRDLPLPAGFGDPEVAIPGALVLRAPSWTSAEEGAADVQRLVDALDAPARDGALDGFPLVVLADDSDFTSRTVSNFVWVTFTRSNPAVDVHGVGAVTVHKHWGCRGPVVIDARIKAHHAPPLVEDPAVTARVDRLGARGASLHGVI
ncbi:MAG: UbiD family decarboxylase [Myxococcales bacterium]|nr:UbiD family decarboxylase [Myxococcales bacterium]